LPSIHGVFDAGNYTVIALLPPPAPYLAFSQAQFKITGSRRRLEVELRWCLSPVTMLTTVKAGAVIADEVEVFPISFKNRDRNSRHDMLLSSAVASSQLLTFGFNGEAVGFCANLTTARKEFVYSSLAKSNLIGFCRSKGSRKGTKALINSSGSIHHKDIFLVLATSVVMECLFSSACDITRYRRGLLNKTLICKV
jgi:hypothetical protein